MNLATKSFFASAVAAACVLAAPAASAAGEAVTCKVTGPSILSQSTAVRVEGCTSYGYECVPNGRVQLSNGQFGDWVKAATNRRSPAMGLYSDFQLGSAAAATGNVEVDLRPSRQFFDSFKSLDWFRIIEPQRAQLAFSYSQLAAGPITRSINLPVLLTRSRVSTVVGQVTCSR